MERVVVFRDLLDELPQLPLLGLQLALHPVELHQLLRSLVLQLPHLRILRPQLGCGLFNALKQLLLQFLKASLVSRKRLDLGLDLLYLALARGLQQTDVLALLSYLLLELLARLLKPLDLLDHDLLVTLPQLALQPVVLLKLYLA